MYRSSNPSIAVIGIILVLAVVILGGMGCHSFLKEDSVHVTIDNKESVNTGDGHEYRVYTDKGTFVMKDSLFKTRYATGDDYGRLKVGKTYDCHKFGWRIPFLSEFENLLDCKEATR